MLNQRLDKLILILHNKNVVNKCKKNTRTYEVKIMNNNLITSINVSTPIRFTSDNNKAKTVNAVKQESLIDRYVNSAYEASKASMVDNSLFSAFGQKVKKLMSLINPKEINKKEVINEAQNVDKELSQYVQSGAYDKEIQHKAVDYVA